MRAGKYDQRIRIERNASSPDPDYGTPSDAVWVEVVTVWAEVKDVLPEKSAESQAAGIRIERRPARIRMRYRTGITSDMRMVHLSRDNRVLKIVSGPAVLGRKEELEFMAEEYSTEGGA